MRGSRALQIGWLAVAFSLWLGVSPAFGTVISTPADQLVLTLRSAIAHCMKAGNDMNALTMEQAMRYLNREVDRVYGAKLSDRFEILGRHGPVNAETNERMLVVASNQTEKRWRLGRYVIWLRDETQRQSWESQDELLRISWEPEEQLKTRFKAAGLPLVDKGLWEQPSLGIGEFFHVNFAWARWILAAIVAFVVLRPLVRRLSE
jgi:hypothetical protein